MKLEQLSLREKIYRRSQQVILENQQPGGGYLACPTMPDYAFSWFRDGAFIAYALTIDGWHRPDPAHETDWQRSGIARCISTIGAHEWSTIAQTLWSAQSSAHRAASRW